MRRLLRWLAGLTASSLFILVVAALVKRVLPSQGDTSSTEFRRVAILGSDQFRSTAPGLRRGHLQVIMGGAELDLRGAELAPGAELHVFVKAGGAQVTVPPTWRVESTVRAMFGGVDSVSPAADPDPAAPLLTVSGLVVFGGVRIVRG
jgi:hypothetical protein